VVTIAQEDQRTQNQGPSAEPENQQSRVKKTVSIAIAAAAILGGIAAGISIWQFVKQATQGASPGIIPTGYYVNGKPGTPHWFIQVSTSQGTEISGTLSFVGQDGQTGGAQTFSGHLQDGLLTLNLSSAGVRTGYVNIKNHPPGIYLDGCTSYLNLAINSLAQCYFSHAADIQGDQTNPGQ